MDQASDLHQQQKRRKPWAALLLGCFVVWQLIYLVLSNALSLQPELRYTLGRPAASPEAKQVGRVIEQLAPGWFEGQGHAATLANHLQTVTDSWSDLTGQKQSWAMYAPKNAHSSVFPAVEIHLPADTPSTISRCLSSLAVDSGVAALVVAEAWHSGQWHRHVLVRSDNEPANIHDFLRFGESRTNRVELDVKIHLPRLDEQSESIRNEVWRRLLRRFVTRNAVFIKAYLRWQGRRFLMRHPDSARPSALILLQREYRIKTPASTTETWQGPSTLPLARWLPNSNRLEVYNPADGHFERLK